MPAALAGGELHHLPVGVEALLGRVPEHEVLHRDRLAVCFQLLQLLPELLCAEVVDVVEAVLRARGMGLKLLRTGAEPFHGSQVSKVGGWLAWVQELLKLQRNHARSRPWRIHA
eukprot:999174-Alexandrium_andersonii.AAC.1